MLTSLDFLNIDQSWPPNDTDTIARLNVYEANKELFEGRQATVYNSMFHKLDRMIPHFKDIIDYPVILNFQKLLSLKTADLLFGESPVITAGKEDSAERKAINGILKNGEISFINTAYMATLDISRYGDGLFYITVDEDNKGYISITPPSVWFPVVSESDIKKIINHVLGWVVCVNPAEKESKRKYQLKVQVHFKGYYEQTVYDIRKNSSVGNFKIQSIAEETKTYQTKLTGFAVVQIHNLSTSDRATGIDDYRDVNSIIYELMVRLSQISKILDRHATPSMQGPESALEKDPGTGEWKIKLGNYFGRVDENDPPVSYLTWDGKLDSAFKEVEVLMNQLVVISELSHAMIGNESEQSGTAASGTALRLRMISPLAKVNRIKMNLTPAIKKAISLASELNGQKIEEDQISIKWQDGLPNDPKEEAEIMNVRTGGKPTMSVDRAIKTYDGLSEKDAQEEQETIQTEGTVSGPTVFDVNNMNNG